MPFLATLGSGAIGAYRMFRGGAAPVVIPYIEDVFSTYLYTGNGSTQTITNGIDLSTYGGLVWTKSRSVGNGHMLFDTVRGINKALFSQGTNAEYSAANLLTAFNSNGFTLGSDENSNGAGGSSVSWTFREQAKFFDVVTWTNSNGGSKTINHNLGSTPGMIIVKRISSTGYWDVWHRSIPNNAMNLNLTDGTSSFNAIYMFGDGTSVIQPTSTTFTVYDGDTNNYVAYLFAHNAGGFGLTGSDNVISCGSFTTNGSGAATVTLGYEPQWILTKRTNGTGSWGIYDVMRGWSIASQNYLLSDSSGAEGTINGTDFRPTATGFNISSPYDASATYIYIAIRRGPMKTPTSDTSVFTPIVRTGTGADTSVTSVGFSPDLVIGRARQNSYSPAPIYTDKLRGVTRQLGSSSTSAESTATNAITGWLNNGYNLGVDTNLGHYNLNTTASNYVSWNFRRAPGFFDVVCFTGTGALQNVPHNLGVTPELVITKLRGFSNNWNVWCGAVENPGALKNVLFLDTTQAILGGANYWGSSTVGGVYGSNMTSSTFSVGATLSESARTYVGYLFASCPGVSKVGKYTGTGTTLSIDCGFTAGARFVLIKRTDSTGDWYVWDTARGIVAGNDPYLLLNSTAVEVTNTDYIDPYSPGFEISSTAPAAINANGGTYIFLAIA